MPIPDWYIALAHSIHGECVMKKIQFKEDSFDLANFEIALISECITSFFVFSCPSKIIYLYDDKISPPNDIILSSLTAMHPTFRRVAEESNAVSSAIFI